MRMLGTAMGDHVQVDPSQDTPGASESLIDELDAEDWSYPEEVREAYAYDDEELRILRGIDADVFKSLGAQICYLSGYNY
ncbi:unnamed protein product [Calypogeia fissa]